MVNWLFEWCCHPEKMGFPRVFTLAVSVLGWKDDTLWTAVENIIGKDNADGVKRVKDDINIAKAMVGEACGINISEAMSITLQMVCWILLPVIFAIES